MLLITIVFTVVVGGVCAQDIKSNLPPCKGEDVKKWSNCFGMVNFPNVEKYVGEFRDGKYHGKGTYYFLADNKYKGDKYSGEFIENIFNGQGEYTSFDGRKYIGEFKYGLVNGRGIYTFPNGDKYIGEFKDDRRSGQGIYTFANGQKQEGIWENGNFIREAKVTLPNLNQAGKLDSSSLERERQLLAELAGRNQEMVSNLPPCKEDDPRKWNNCFAPLYYPNGDKYVGEWKDGNTSGFGAYFSLAESPFKGDRYVGEWKNGLRNGKGTYYHLAENKNKGDKYIGDWKNDERNGQGAFYHLAENQNKGDKYVGEWKSGEKNGLGIYTYANGIKLEGVWDNGSFIREAKVNLPIINANQTDIAVLDRERQQLQSELRKLEEEKRNREQARNNQRINLQVSNTQPDSTGAFTITIKTNSDTASLQIDGVEEGG